MMKCGKWILPCILLVKKWAQYSDCEYSNPMYIISIVFLILQGNHFFNIFQTCNFSVCVSKLPEVIILPDEQGSYKSVICLP